MGHKLDFFLGYSQVFRNEVKGSRPNDFTLEKRKKTDIQESVVFEEGCKLFSSEEGVFERRGTGEVITAVAETTKLACS